MRLLDLFCGDGGAAAGYARAGFDEIVGVDLADHSRFYPFEFHRADALTFPIDGFDAVHASPPCQFYANVTRWRRRNWTGDAGKHPALIEPTRERLQDWGGPFVIENVRTGALRDPVVLCGSTFGLEVRRHRYFETSFESFELVPSCNHAGLRPFMHKGERAYADAMGCDWMPARSARQAVPPAFTEYMGARLLEAVERARQSASSALD